MLVAAQINLFANLQNLLGTGINAKGTALTTFYLDINFSHRLSFLPMDSVHNSIIKTNSLLIYWLAKLIVNLKKVNHSETSKSWIADLLMATLSVSRGNCLQETG
jgi:hypothetical protein